MSKFEIAVRLYKMYLIIGALKEFNGNQVAAARSLGIHRNSLARSIKVLGIKLDKKEPQRVRRVTPLAAAAIAGQRRA